MNRSASDPSPRAFIARSIKYLEILDTLDSGVDDSQLRNRLPRL